MIPFIPIAAVALLGKLIYEAVKEQPDYSEIDHENVYVDYMINQDKEKLTSTILKQKTTRAVNKIQKEYKGFKIGKSGNPKERQGSTDYTKYKGMYVLCASSDSDVISDLEGYYNEKYIKHKKNDNKKEGSAGVTTDSNGVHYLYVSVR